MALWRYSDEMVQVGRTIIRQIEKYDQTLDVLCRSAGEPLPGASRRDMSDISTYVFALCSGLDKQEDEPWWVLRVTLDQAVEYVAFPDSGSLGMMIRQERNGALRANLAFRWNRDVPGYTVEFRYPLDNKLRDDVDSYVFFVRGGRLDNPDALPQAIRSAFRLRYPFEHPFCGRVQGKDRDTAIEQIGRVLPQNEHVVVDV